MVVGGGERGDADTERESALKVDSGKKILCRTGESNLLQRRAGPMLYPESYIPIPSFSKSIEHLNLPKIANRRFFKLLSLYFVYVFDDKIASK